MYALEIELKFLLVVEQCQEEIEGVAVVGIGAGEYELEVEAADGFPVEVDIAGDGLLLAGDVEGLKMTDETFHHLLSSVHGFDVTMNLSVHLIAHKFVDAFNLNTI